MEQQTAIEPGTPQVEATFTAGQLVAGRYRIRRFIALGGMGEVYEAEDGELGGPIALKVIRADAARDGTALERFRREVQASRRITHPNVCKLFDIEHHADPVTKKTVTFLTMEFLPGDTLAEKLDHGPLSPEEALPIVRQIAAALEAAHRAGVVHRDLKPGNVILVPEGKTTRAVVTDFNLAALHADDGGSHGSRLTQGDLVVGTACYMAPEQAQGLPITGRADVYALGVVLFEMVTGRLPHEADSAVTLLLKRLREAPPDPRSFRADLPQAWSAAILRALALQPEERFASAAELVAALEKQRPVAVPAFPSAPRRAPRAAAAALAVVALAAVLWMLRAPRREPATAPLSGVQLTASLGLDLYPDFAPAGNAIVFASDRSGSFELYRRALDGAAETPLTADGRDNVEPVFSPDGTLVVYHSRKEGGLRVVSALGGTPRTLTRFGSRPAFSPDGTQVLFQSEPLIDLSPNAAALPPSTIWVVPIAGGAPRALTTPGRPEGGHGQPVFSRDGARVLFMAADSRNAELWQMDANGGSLARLLAGVPMLRDPVFSPDGRSLYVCTTPKEGSPALLRYRVDADGRLSPRGEAVTTVASGKIRHLAVSRDGRRIAYSILSVSSNVWTLGVDPATGAATAPPRPLTAETGRMSRPAFSPDGARIAFSRYRSGASDDLFVMPKDGGAMAQVTSDPSAETWPSWFADGLRLAFFTDAGGVATYRWRSLTDGSEGVLLEPGMGFDAPRLSRDGTRVAWSSRRGGRMNVWVAELSRGAAGARQVTFDSELMGWPCWSPDGTLLAVQARRGTDTHLGVVPAAGGAAEMLVTDPGQSWAGSFSPDGDRIAFAGQRGGVWNIYAVSRKTRLVTQLTRFDKTAEYVRYPSWSPAGDRIAFEQAENSGNIFMVRLP